MNFIIIFLFLLIIINIIYLTKNICVNNIEPFEQNKVEIVISRYNEDLEWLKEEPFTKYNIIIYNKGINDNFYKAPNIIKIIPLQNVGREGHTYLYHIINNYDNLAELTVFLPGSVQLPYKRKIVNLVFDKILYTNKSILPCRNDKTKSIYELESNFTINSYELSDENNKKLNNDNKIELSNIRPFGKWYNNKFDKNIFDKFKCITVNGIMAITKEDIYRHSIDYYQDFINELDKSSHPETGHFIERSWEPIFEPVDYIKIYI